MKIDFYLGFFIMVISFSCSKKVHYDLNKYPVSVGNKSAKEMLSSISDDEQTFSALFNFDPTTFKKELKRKSYLIINKDSNKIQVSAVNIMLNPYERGDSLFIKPYGDYLGLYFNKKVKIRIGKNQGTLRKVELDTSSNQLVGKITISPFIYKHSSKVQVPLNVNFIDYLTPKQTQIDLKLRDFTKQLDITLKAQGDLIPKSWSMDAYWHGPTSIQRIEGNRIHFISRLEAQLWAKKFGIKTRLWKHTSELKFQVVIENKNGDIYPQIRSFNFKHFPGELEQKIQPSINSAFAKSGLGSSLPGYSVKLVNAEFGMIDSNSISIRGTLIYNKKH